MYSKLWLIEELGRQYRVDVEILVKQLNQRKAELNAKS